MENESIARHLNERRVRTGEEEEEESVIQEDDEQVNVEIANMIQELEKTEINEGDERGDEDAAAIAKAEEIQNEETQETEVKIINDENKEQESNSSGSEENNYPETNFRFQILKDEKYDT